MMATTPTTYIPESYSTNVPTYADPIAPPSGLAPLPLPTSHNYVRPVKQHTGGFGASVKNALSRATNRAQRSWNEGTDERFRRFFGFPFAEQLFGEWWGDVWSGGLLISCSVYVSTNYLCILYKKKDAQTKDKVHIKATIALRDITFLQRAICLPPSSGKTPVIQALTDPNVKADSIIIYTNDGKMHQLCNFFNFETFTHTLEWNWKTLRAGGAPSTIPASGVILNPGQPAVQNQTYTQTGVLPAASAGVPLANPAQPVLVKQTTTTQTPLSQVP